MTLLVVLAAATAMCAAGMSSLSLPSLDDCFYARKGVELGRSGGFFAVTWAGQPAFQNPPLPFWILGRSFAVFGENDFAARLPSLLMAIGTLVITYRIGRLAFGADSAVTAVALLLVTPLFVENARRSMTEIPLTFWVSAVMLLYLKAVERPRFYLLAGLALGAAVLTKSVLGLLPLLVLAVVLAIVPASRSLLRTPWSWLGVAIGLVVGASWTIHLGLRFGSDAIRAHYMGEIASRSTAGFDPLAIVTGYALILLSAYQPLVIPGVIEAYRLAGPARRASDARRLLVVIWVFLPVLLYSFGAARSDRYLFPILPPLALCAGHWLARALPRPALYVSRYIVPSIALIVAIVFWASPRLLTRDLNAIFKERVSVLRSSIPPDETLTYFGDRYWEFATPLMYYAERSLEPSAPSVTGALDAARRSRSRLLLVDGSRLGELSGERISYETVLEGPRWVLLAVSEKGVGNLFRGPAADSPWAKELKPCRPPRATSSQRHVARMEEGVDAWRMCASA